MWHVIGGFAAGVDASFFSFSTMDVSLEEVWEDIVVGGDERCEESDWIREWGEEAGIRLQQLQLRSRGDEEEVWCSNRGDGGWMVG